MSAGRATIDGVSMDVRGRETILEAAARLGIEIPTLCHIDGLPPEGGCRLCLVQTHGDDGPLAAACHSRLEGGMDVRTSSDRIEDLRRDIRAMIEQTSLAPREPGGPPAPFLRFDPALCIMCRRCLNVCEGVQGQFVYGIEGRGAGTRLLIGATDEFTGSACTSCGACVDHCPTGAVSDVDRLRGGAATSTTQSVCGYCGVGCRVEVETAAGRVLRIRGAPEAAVNRGHLCLKGRYAHGWQRSPDRLHVPLRREGQSLVPVSWDEALSWLARRLGEIRDRHGPAALGALSSSRSTNEAAYLLQKLFRTRIGTNNVDCCARVCHSSTAIALQMATGAGAASASFADIERASCIVVAGANPTEAHPVVGARIKQAALRGTPLLVIDPRRIELAEYAALHLRLRAGTNVAAFNAIARLLVQRGLVDRAFIDERTEGFDALGAFLENISPAECERVTGVRACDFQAAAALIGRGPALFVSGLGLSETTQGTASVLALCNLAMLTGSIGRPGAGMLPLRGQNNVQGNADMGGMPDQVTGYQSVDDPAVRAALERIWGTAPPPGAGRTIPEMIEAAGRREIRALWIQGEDVAQSDPCQERVIAALEALDLLVVQEIFLSETARRAHLVLPAAGWLEQDGTFTNAERRIQLVQRAVPPPGEARADWSVVCDVARAMGERWTYQTAADVFDEIARVAPHLFGGVSHARLADEGIQWPCPGPEHPGTATLHAGGFMRGRGRFMAIDFLPSPEHDVPGFPYLLITGRVLDHYNVGTMTRRTACVELVPHDALEIHPDDARALAVAEGDRVEIESRWGRTGTVAHLSRRVAPGTVFLSFHFAETHTNRLVGPQLDPLSRCPEYKVTSVRVRRAE